MFQRQELTIALCDLLRGVNGEIAYDRITAVAGKPMDDLRPTLANVRRYLERDEGIVFEAVRGKGLRRLTDAEKVESAAGFTRRIRRTAGRGVTRLDAVAQPEALSNEDQMRLTLQKTAFEAIQRTAQGE